MSSTFHERENRLDRHLEKVKEHADHNLAARNLGQFSTGDFDRGTSRIGEAWWVAFKCLFFLPSLPLPSSLRAFLLSFCGAKIGAGSVIRSRVNISFPWRLALGDHVWLGEEVNILSLAQVMIESNVCISQRAFLCTGSHDYRRADFALITKPITIRSGAWIAAQSFIGPGVTVGEGAVVSAGSVVLRDVPAWTVVQGNPAKVVKEIAPGSNVERPTSNAERPTLPAAP